MANKARGKNAERDRKARVEALRREQAAKERRKSAMFLAVAILVAVGLIAAVLIPAYLKRRNDPAKQSVSKYGVAIDAADCTKVETTKGTNTDALRKHVEDNTVEKYKTVPPSFGPHWASPIYPALSFYSAGDRPPMERLVHNLEHGYTVLWYDKTIKGAQVEALKKISTSARAQDATKPAKFIVSSWDPKYGTFPSGKHVGISHWGEQSSHIQLCGKVSGALVDSFISAYPASDAPEAGAQ